MSSRHVFCPSLTLPPRRRPIVHDSGSRRDRQLWPTADPVVSVGYCLNRVGDLLGHRMMHHVPCPRYQLELAVQDLLVKPDGLTADIHDLVVAAGHDHHGQAQLTIAVPHRRRLASHAGAILGLGSDLQWPNRHAALEALLEALRHRQRREFP